MPNDSDRRPVRRVAAAAAIVLTFAASWLILDRTENRPRWVAVEGPAEAVAGSRVVFRVRLKRADPGSLVACTLHHADAERKTWGYLASSGPARPAVAGQAYDFEFMAPQAGSYAYVFAIVDLSPTGRWPDATRAVSTAYVPLTGPEGPERPAVLRPLRLYHYPTTDESVRAAARPQRPQSRSSLWVHPVLGALLLAAALAAARAARRSRHGAGAGAIGERTVWIALALVMAAAAAVEISGLAGHVAAWGRRWAEARGIYELRQPVQKTIMAALAAVSLGFFFLFIKAVRKPGSHRALWWSAIGLAAYLAVSFAGVLSFHAVDVVRRFVWHGVSPVDGARGAAAVVALVAAFVAARRRTGGAT